MVVGDFEDLAVLVVVARVRLVGRGTTVDSALGVVGQCDINLAALRVCLEVLGAVHLRCPDLVAGLAGEDGYLFGTHAVDQRFALAVFAGAQDGYPLAGSSNLPSDGSLPLPSISPAEFPLSFATYSVPASSRVMLWRMAA